MKVLTLFIFLVLAAPASGAELQGQPSPIEQSTPSDSTGLQDPASADEIKAYLSEGSSSKPPISTPEPKPAGFLVALGLITLALVTFRTLRHSPLRLSQRPDKKSSPAGPSPFASPTRRAKKKRP